MRTAYLTPLPPVRSGIASYSAMLLPALARKLDLTVVVSQETWEPCPVPVMTFEEYRGRRAEFDAAIYQLGNNPHHEFVYQEALQHPGIAVLHEIVLHHLIAEITMARGDIDGYRDAMKENHGPLGEAVAEARAAGFHGELGNFMLPASLQLAGRSRALVVHNRYAADRLRDLGVATPIHVIAHPFVAPGRTPGRSSIRSRLGYGETDRVVGMFGFVTAAKRPEVVFEAFSAAAALDPSLKLLVVGEPAPNVDLATMAVHFNAPPGSWQATGYVADGDFDGYIEAVDLVVGLRYPTAGETSGALLRVLWAGKPVAVSDYAQFAEFPREIVSRIELGKNEIGALVVFLLDAADPALASARRKWVEENAGVEASAAAYAAVVLGTARAVEISAPGPGRLPLALFPEIGATLRRLDASAGGELAIIRLANGGSEVIPAAVYGEPGYRIVVKGFRADRECFDRWVQLPRDFRPGEVFDLPVPLPEGRGGASQLRLFHALEGIPFAERDPFAVLELEV